MIGWKELGRPERNILQRLYGGGSLRNCDPEIILRLKQLGLIEGKERHERLSPLGLALVDHTHAQLNERLGASLKRKMSGSHHQT